MTWSQAEVLRASVGHATCGDKRKLTHGCFKEEDITPAVSLHSAVRLLPTLSTPRPLPGLGPAHDRSVERAHLRT